MGVLTVKRSKPLRRRSPLRRKPRRRKTTEAGRAYMLAVKQLPCAAGSPWSQYGGACAGPIHAHHAGRRPGVGMKAPDDTCIPLCQHHHAKWHDGGPPFMLWSKKDRRAWADWHIERTRSLIAGRVDTATGSAL